MPYMYRQPTWSRMKDVNVKGTFNNDDVLRCKIITELEEENQLKTEEIIKIRKVNRNMAQQIETLE